MNFYFDAAVYPPAIYPPTVQTIPVDNDLTNTTVS